MNIGWEPYDDEVGYGWSGAHIDDPGIALYGYDDVSGYSVLQQSYVYDDYGRDNLFEFALANGRYDVTIGVGRPATGYPGDPHNATIEGIVVEDGATVVAGDVLAILEEGEVAAASAPAAEEEKPEPEKAPAQKAAKGPAKTSPAVRRLLDEHDLDATMVAGTGKDGRITKGDVMAFLKSDDSSEVTPGDPTPDVGVEVVTDGLAREEKRVPMTRLRARIAERLVEAQQTAAMLTTFNEVDLTNVMAMRSKYRDVFEKKHGVRLGFMSFFAKASVEALKKFPVVNASVEGSDIVSEFTVSPDGTLLETSRLTRFEPACRSCTDATPRT